MKTKIRPLHDKLLVRRQAAEDTIGGIIVPDTAKKKTVTGEVLAVGPGRLRKTSTSSFLEYEPMMVKPGDNIVFAEFAGTDIKIDGEKMLLLSESDVLGVLVPQ